MQTTEFLLKQNGSVTRRRMVEEEIQISEEVLLAMAGNFHRVCRDAFIVAGSSAHLAITEKSTFVTVGVPIINLKAPFKTQNESVTPAFDSKNEPIMSIQWSSTVFGSMRLVMLIELNHSPTYQKWNYANAWLVAFDPSKRAYRLPLPNVHNDCRMCLGDFSASNVTVSECVAAVLAQFESSPWNADLWGDNRAKTAALFSFKPTNSGFDQIPPDSHWDEFCDKVAFGPLKYVL